MVCKDNTGAIVDDSLCPSPKPATSQACSSGGISPNTSSIWRIEGKYYCGYGPNNGKGSYGSVNELMFSLAPGEIQSFREHFGTSAQIYSFSIPNVTSI